MLHLRLAASRSLVSRLPAYAATATGALPVGFHLLGHTPHGTLLPARRRLHPHPPSPTPTPHRVSAQVRSRTVLGSSTADGVLQADVVAIPQRSNARVAPRPRTSSRCTTALKADGARRPPIAKTASRTRNGRSAGGPEEGASATRIARYRRRSDFPIECFVDLEWCGVAQSEGIRVCPLPRSPLIRLASHTKQHGCCCAGVDWLPTYGDDHHCTQQPP